jgi:hypothetical protein
MMLMFYGLCTFLRRQRNIRAHKPTGYDDPHGPVVLTFVLAFATITYLMTKGGIVYYYIMGGDIHNEGARYWVGVSRSKEFEMRIRPEYFTNRSQATEMMVRTLQNIPEVDYVDTSTIREYLARRYDLDTANQDFAQNEVTLKLDERLMANGAPIRNGASLTLKIGHDDPEVLLATPSGCATRFARQCQLKVEQNVFPGRTSFHRSSKLEKMHMDTSVTSMREMKAFVHLGEGILKKMPHDDTPLLVNRVLLRWRIFVPFYFKTTGVRHTLDIDLYHNTLFEAMSETTLPLDDSEVSFKIDDFSAISVTESHGIYSHLLDASWARIRDKDGKNRYKNAMEKGGEEGHNWMDDL